MEILKSVREIRLSSKEQHEIDNWLLYENNGNLEAIKLYLQKDF